MGRSAQCKECRYKRKRDKYHTDATSRTKEREQQRHYYQKHREALLAKAIAYQQANAVKRAIYISEYRKRPGNQDKANQRSKVYRDNPKNKMVLSHRQALYHYRKYEAQGFSTKDQLQARWEYYGGRCWICVNEATEIDHVIPLTKGGTNWPANLKPICRSCNARKSNTWPYPLLTV